MVQAALQSVSSLVLFYLFFNQDPDDPVSGPKAALSGLESKKNDWELCERWMVQMR